jgi:hypothetical protein
LVCWPAAKPGGATTRPGLAYTSVEGGKRRSREGLREGAATVIDSLAPKKMRQCAC